MLIKLQSNNQIFNLISFTESCPHSITAWLLNIIKNQSNNYYSTEFD